MAVVVESSADQGAAALNHGVFPVPPEVAADNARRDAKTDPNASVTKAATTESSKDTVKPDQGGTKDAEADKSTEDDTEGEDGLTPRQKREFTKAMQATIGKKHRMQREAEEFAQTQYNEKQLANERAAKLETDLAALREQLKPAKVEDAKKPERTAFKDDQEYWDAMVDYRADLKLAAFKAEQSKAEQDRFIQEETAHAQAKMDRAFEQGPEDFKDVYEGADIVLPNYVLETIKASDLMPELVYHLGTHIEAAEKIKAMTDGCPVGSARYARAAQRQLVEIGKIESTLKPFSKEKENNGDKPSQETVIKTEPETGSSPSKPRVIAPIIKPLNGGSTSQVEKDEADMTGSQVITRWQKKAGVVLTARKRH